MIQNVSKITSSTDLAQLRQRLTAEAATTTKRILVCSTGCLAAGARDVGAAIRQHIQSAGLQDEIQVVDTGCHGLCALAPVIIIEPDDIVYGKIRVKDVPRIVEETVQNGQIIDRFCYGRSADMSHLADIPFYANQIKNVLRHVGRVDPKTVDDAIQRGAYAAAAKALTTMSPEQVIEEMATSGLRGRGGAGFPVGTKWSISRKSTGDAKYLICNADEGDPGAFMDRALLEGDPHGVLEGMLIAAYAIGCTHGFIYVRAEYPIAVRHVHIALHQVRERGLLGNNILGTGFDFDIEVREGAGAFVCGEETALIGSLEGNRGMARPRPPFPAEKGYLGQPTNINNVETFANVPLIIEHGGAAYAQRGTEGSKGTKIFALAGKVKNTGLVEVPMGVKIRDIVFDVGGGMPGKRTFKAVQMGGPSGGCVPTEHLDLPIDYDSLRDVGAIMGSGGMIVMDDKTCIVDIARYFMAFVQDESCGKCAPCRVGTARLLEILERICAGHGTMEDLDELKQLATMVQTASGCGLGQTGPNPVLSTLRHFRDEYLAHVVDKQCPAGVCTELITYSVIDENCTGCLACKRVCPSEAITGELKEVHVIDKEKCIKCGACLESCKFDAILVE